MNPGNDSQLTASKNIILSADTLVQQSNQEKALELLQLAFRSTNQDRAVKYCRQALELDPEQKLAHYHTGLIYAAKMRWPEAAECLSRALEIDPADPSLSFNLGTICINAGWLDQAETCFLRAKELDPVCEGAHYYLAIVYLRKGQLQKALNLATLALRLRPTECTIKKENFVELIAQIEAEIQTSSSPKS
jgi:tetratricopeptide (TPR) repeat protein